MYLQYAYIVTVLFLNTVAQSVVQQCLTEQIRDNLNSHIQAQNNGTPEATTIAAFDSICRNYESYMNCFQTRLEPSNHPADTFLQLIFSKPDMQRAYKGLCTLDLENLRPNVRCLLSTPEIRRCYSNFNQGINKVVNLQVQKDIPRALAKELACNVSVARYRCETDVYTLCNSRTGEIMQDFFFAGIPNTCRISAGVQSRYVNIFNGGNPPFSDINLIIFVLICTLKFG